jgi:hypothetical protein
VFRPDPRGGDTRSDNCARQACTATLFVQPARCCRVRLLESGSHI